MINKTALVAALGLLLACACSNGTTPGRVEANESQSEEEAGGVYQRPMDKARNVEDQLQDAADKHKRDVKEQEGGG